MSDTSLPADRLLALSPEKLALYALGLHRRLEAVGRERNAPLALVGVAGRFPGGAEGLDGLWRLLDEGRDAIGPVPADRWDAAALYRPHPAPPGFMCVREGGFLSGIDRFDAAFFGISPREAAAMDPQQRLALEMAWRALEHAAIAPDRLTAAAAGVYLGIASQDYSRLVAGPGGDLARMDAHFGSGNGASVAAGRIAYQLGLKGPAVAIDTACSSSLVALHLACQALRARQIDLALVGGVNAILSPAGHVALSQTGMLAPDGRCKTFDARADGFVRSEGAVMTVLKRLDDARADGDRVLAVIRGTALNQDGRSSSLTAPNGGSQEALIAAALRDAGVAPADVGYLETHGTGTPLGDPIEVGAAGRAYGIGRADDRPLLLGALKSAVGHMETAAGLGGLVKLAGIFAHGRIPANLHLAAPSPLIPWGRLPVRPVSVTTPWTGPDRIAGLSAFGYSGTNAHAVVGAPPEAPSARLRAIARPLCLGAQGHAALAALAREVGSRLAVASDETFAGIAHTVMRGRALMPVRLGLGAASGPEAARLIEDRLADFVPDRSVAGGVAFLFTGQGAQFAGMGAGPLRESAAFRALVAELEPLVRGREGWDFADLPLTALLTGEPGAPDLVATRYAQPALYAYETAMAALWAARGVRPAMVIGHSLGDLAAAAVAGAVSRTDGFRLALARGELVQACPPGAMASIEAAREEAAALLTDLGGHAVVAAVNGPALVSIAGPVAAIEAAVDACAARGIRARRLSVSHAFHSPAMEPAMAGLDAAAAAIAFTAPTIPLITNVEAGWAGEDTLAAPGYWSRHLRRPVDFLGGLQILLRDDVSAGLEMGPQPQLLPLLAPAATAAGRPTPRGIASARRDRPFDRTLAEAGAALAEAGHPLDAAGWARDGGESPAVTDAPGAPMTPLRHWLDPKGGEGLADASLLGRRVATPLAEAAFETHLSTARPAWLADHRVAGRVLAPATLFVQLMAEAAHAVLGTDEVALTDIVLAAPLELGAQAHCVHTLVTGEADGRRVRVHAQAPGGDFWLHAEAAIGPAGPASEDPAPAEVDEPRDLDALRDGQRLQGLDFGPAFLGLREVRLTGDGRALARLALPEAAGAAPRFGAHPALLDAGLQALGILADPADYDGRVLVPASVARVVLRGALGEGGTCRATLTERGAAPAAALFVLDGDGRRVVEIEGLRLRPLGAERAPPPDWFWRLDWREIPAGGSRSDGAGPAGESAAVTAAVTAAAAPLLADLAEDDALAGYHRFLAAVEAIGPATARAALAGLDAAAIAPGRRRLAARVEAIARMAGAEADPATALARLAADWPEQGPEIAMLRRCAAGLGDVLRGGDPVPLLFAEDGIGGAEAVYTQSPLAAAVARLAGRAIRALALDAPRVLEIGAGTGSLTRIALSHLPETGRTYVYTDVSPVFLEHGRRLFGQAAGTRFALFDAERPPGGQGQAAGGFDLVLASNVIHATRRLDESLAHARALLAPGGFLLLLEATGRRIGADLTFGLTDGWWRFADAERRPDHPLLDRAGWRRALADSGFETLAVLPDRDGGPLAEHALILARRPHAEGPARPWLLLGGQTVAAALAQRLAGAGERAIRVAAGDEAGLERALAAEPERIVDLRALDPRPLADPALAVTETAVGLCAGVSDLVRRIGAGERRPPKRLLLVGRGTAFPEAAGPDAPGDLAGAALTGLARVLTREHPPLCPGLLDLDPLADTEADVAALLAAASGERPELAARRGRLFAPALAPDPAAPLRRGPWRVAIGTRGGLSALSAQPLDRRAPGPGEVEIAVEAVALNFRDVLNALGLYPGALGDPGEECAGTVLAVGEGVSDLTVGEPVVAVAAAAMATHLTAPAALVRRRPAGLTPVEAATLPVAYLTAAVALLHVAKLRPGERLLIHAAAGGVGLAALHLARAAGAEVFATAHPDKWTVLRACGLSEDALASSRVPGFAAKLHTWSGGRGADVVLNCLADPFIGESFEALAPGGRFVEIGRRGIWSPERAREARPDAAYHPLVIAEAFARDPEGVRAVYDAVLARISAGDLPPLPRRVLPAAQFEEAFALMARGEHVGRLVLDFASAHAPLVRADGTYLVTGGLRGLGPLVGRWLAEQGAGRLALVGRRPPDAAGAAAITAMRAAGAAVEAVTLDVADTDALAALVERLDRDGPPLRGIVHAAGLLDDGPLAELDAGRYRTVAAPKVAAALALDRLSRGRPVETFVLFSAGAALFGSPGQANHAAANAVLDALAQARRREGLPALSVDWGPWSGAGAAAADATLARIRAQGMGAIDPARGLEALSCALRGGLPQAAVLPLLSETFAARHDAESVPPIIREVWEDWRGRAAPAAEAVAPAPEPGPVLPRDPAALAARLHREAVRALGLDAGAEIDPERPLREIGLDSLISVDLRNRLAQAFDLSLPATLLFDHPSLAALAREIGGRLWPAVPPTAPAMPVAPAEPTPGPDSRAIAIVGIGCRFPGGVVDRAGFWAFLARGGDGVVPVPADRWDVEAWYDPDPDAPGRTYMRRGGFLDRIDGFDAAFFGISPAEAATMDPQQRLLLEVAWEALEDAGIPADRLADSETGVYVGICGSDYVQRVVRAGTASADMHFATGSAVSVAAGRIAYTLGLQGPALAVDTACSSSLLAVHLARRALLEGECDLALAGGVAAMLEPQVAAAFARNRVLAADGRTKAFDAGADGMVRGEGCGVVALKRLPDALADGDPVIAVIRGSAVNQDGRSAGLTAPNGPAQEKLIRRALADAGVAPASVGLLETHGTGTPLGDPIEAGAAGRVYGEGRPDGAPLRLGAVKTNLGHLEGAAGIAGLIKAALSLRAGLVPANLHFTRPSPHIPWQELPLAVPVATEAWPALPGPRRAGVSSFGFSGTNVHAVLEQPPEPPGETTAPAAPAAALLLVSARDPAALAELARRTAAVIDGADAARFARLAAESQHRRAAHGHRLAVAARDGDEARAALLSWLDGGEPARLARGRVRPNAPKVAFLFSGQGGQWTGMAADLIRTDPVFRAALAEAADACAAAGQAGVFETLAAGQAPTGFRAVQATLFCVQVALYARLAAYGLRPAMIAGHSVGEVAAAHAAGMLSLSDAARLVVVRSRLLARLEGCGGMIVLGLPRAEAEGLAASAAGAGPACTVAAVNGRATTVLCGDGPALDRLRQAAEARRVFHRDVAVTVPAHSPLTAPLRHDFLAALADLAPAAPAIPIVSTALGTPFGERPADAGYWWDNLSRPVLGAEAIRWMAREGATHVVEIGAHPILDQAIEGEGEGRLVPLGCLPRDEPGPASLLAVLGRLHADGFPFGWAAVSPRPRGPVALPLYPWTHRRHWIAGDVPPRPPGSPPAPDAVREEAPVAVPWDSLLNLDWRPQPVAARRLLAGEDWTVMGGSPALAEAVTVALSEAGATVRGGTTPEAGARVIALFDPAAGDPAGAALSALTELRRLALAGPAALWCATRGAQALPGDRGGPDPLGAALTAMRRVIALERPEIQGGTIDGDPQAGPEAVAEGILAALAAADGEDQCAWRGAARFVPRIVRWPETPLLPIPPAPGPRALVTGGLGGIGLQLAEWLARRGVAEVVLCGRRPPGPEAQARLDALRAAGTRVVVAALDVTDGSGLADLLRRTGPVAVVMHAAGLSEAARLEATASETFARMLAPKLAGLYALEAALEAAQPGVPPAWFVAFSSGAALWGAEGQAAYAAANAALDAAMARRRARGLPALSIAFGWWEGSGLVDTAAADYFRERGLRPVPADGCLAALGYLLAAGAGRAAVSDMDWSLFRSLQEVRRRRPLLAAMAEPGPAETGEGALARRLAALAPAERIALLEDEIAAMAAQTLGFSGPDEIDREGGFFQMGMDSVRAVKLRGRLRTALGRDVPPSLAFEFPTVRDLARHLAGSEADPHPDGGSEGGESHERPAPPDPFDDLFGRIAGLDEAAVDALLGGATEGGGAAASRNDKDRRG